MTAQCSHEESRAYALHVLKNFTSAHRVHVVMWLSPRMATCAPLKVSRRGCKRARAAYIISLRCAFSLTYTSTISSCVLSRKPESVNECSALFCLALLWKMYTVEDMSSSSLDQIFRNSFFVPKHLAQIILMRSAALNDRCASALFSKSSIWYAMDPRTPQSSQSFLVSALTIMNYSTNFLRSQTGVQTSDVFLPLFSNAPKTSCMTSSFLRNSTCPPVYFLLVPTACAQRDQEDETAFACFLCRIRNDWWNHSMKRRVHWYIYTYTVRVHSLCNVHNATFMLPKRSYGHGACFCCCLQILGCPVQWGLWMYEDLYDDYSTTSFFHQSFLACSKRHHQDVMRSASAGNPAGETSCHWTLLLLTTHVSAVQGLLRLSHGTNVLLFPNSKSLETHGPFLSGYRNQARTRIMESSV